MLRISAVSSVLIPTFHKGRKTGPKRIELSSLASPALFLPAEKTERRRKGQVLSLKSFRK
jgi:hypothetical protein